jgi:hypothetical protein
MDRETNKRGDCFAGSVPDDGGGQASAKNVKAASPAARITAQLSF